MSPEDVRKLIDVWGPAVFAIALAVGNFINGELQRRRNNVRGKVADANMTQLRSDLQGVNDELTDSNNKLRESLEARVKVLESELADCLDRHVVPV